MRLSGSTVTIIRTDPHRHKFGSAMAEYLYEKMNDWGERSDGDAEAPTGWWCQFGKRILWGDSRGFVDVDTHPTLVEANNAVAQAEVAYSEWLNSEED